MSFMSNDIYPEIEYLQVPLYAHQIDFIEWAKDMIINQGKGFILGDSMGLGKTRETCFLVAYLEASRVLIACPKSVIYQWAAECLNTCTQHEIYFMYKNYAERIFYDGNNIIVGDRVNFSTLVNTDRNIICICTFFQITPYPDVKSNGLITSKEIELNTPLKEYVPELTPFNDFEWSMVVVDEAHTLRNGITIASEKNKSRPKTLKFHRMFRLRLLEGGVKIALTGTPIQNRKSDLVSLLSWIGADLPTKIDDFWIEDIVKEYVFRRTPLDLHPELRKLINFPTSDPNSYNIYVDYKSAEERDFYELAANIITKDRHIKNSLEGTPYENIVSPECPLEKINMLRFLSVSIDMFIRIYNKHNSPLPTWHGTETKIEMIRDSLFELAETNTSVIIFVHFYEEADRIQNALTDYDEFFGPNLGYHVYRLNGECSAQERNAILAKTKDYIENKNERCLVFANVLSSSEGLNMQHFNTIIFSSPDYNPKLEEQAEARVNRIGQKNPVTVYRFLHRALESMRPISKTDYRNIDTFIESLKDSKLLIFEQIFEHYPNAAYFAPKIEMPGFPGEKAVIFKEKKIPVRVKPAAFKIPTRSSRPLNSILSKAIERKKFNEDLDELISNLTS